MKQIFLHITLFILLAACSAVPQKKPIWVNAKTTVAVPSDSLVFKANEGNWSAVLLSFTQPVLLKIKYNKDGFVIQLKNNNGLTEGQAQLMLTNNSQNFYYDVTIANDSTGTITEKDYRSPKTVNTDSSLKQQRIIHSIDEWRNVVLKTTRPQFFYEAFFTLQPKTGTFEAQAGKPLSAYYILAGSPATIGVASKFITAKNIFKVTAGPLKDPFSNTVANGTKVAFEYTNGKGQYTMEAVLLHGFATVFIPANEKPIVLQARVNKTVSAKINLIKK